MKHVVYARLNAEEMRQLEKMKKNLSIVSTSQVISRVFTFLANNQEEPVVQRITGEYLK